MNDERALKQDLFGKVSIRQTAAGAVIVRDARCAHWSLRWLAKRLLQREASTLAAVEGLAGTPQLLQVEPDRLQRTYLEGAPLHESEPPKADFFREAAALLRRLHRVGVVHNDLAKEPNILVRSDGAPAFIDYQLAWHSRNRGRLFRIAAYEDIRHLLKHKRTYCAAHLTQRELGILANPSPLSRIWMGTFKPVYLFVTRRLLGWADREGAADRGAPR